MTMMIRELLMASMVSLVLGGCSVSFMGNPNSAAPGYNYGYGSAGKPISSVDHGQTDDRGKPSANDSDSPPTAEPSPPQRDKPTRPGSTDKPPTRPDPASKDPNPFPTRPGPTRPGSTDKPSTRPDPVKDANPFPTRPGSTDRPTTRPDPASKDANPFPTRPDPTSTKPDAQRKPQSKPAPKQRVGVTTVDAPRAVLHRAPTR